MNGSAKWAIITGASSGIGRALADEFGAGGYNLFLTGRNETALREVAATCTERFHCQTQICIADLAQPDSVTALVNSIQAKGREYDILVNNAGFGIHGEFASTPIQSEMDLVQVQVTAALQLTKAVLPGMIKRRHGRILFVGSVYSYSPVPLQSVYSACKAFLLSFCASLRNEVAPAGITVTAFCPGITQTEFRSRAGIAEKNKESGMPAEEAAHIAYVEALRGTAVVIPGIPNRLFVLAAKILPNTVFTNVIRSINRLRGHAGN